MNGNHFAPPGSSALADHPRTAYLVEEIVLEPLNKWLCQVFDRKSVDRPDVATAKKRLADAEAKLRRFQDAIAAGVDPAVLVTAINEVEEIRAAASAELKGFRAQTGSALRPARDRTSVRKAEEAVYATTSPRVLSERVREGT